MRDGAREGRAFSPIVRRPRDVSAEDNKGAMVSCALVLASFDAEVRACQRGKAGRALAAGGYQQIKWTSLWISASLVAQSVRWCGNGWIARVEGSYAEMLRFLRSRRAVTSLPVHDGSQDEHRCGRPHAASEVLSCKCVTTTHLEFPLRDNCAPLLLTVLPRRRFRSAKTLSHALQTANSLRSILPNEGDQVEDERLSHLWFELTRTHQSARGRRVRHPRIFGPPQTTGAASCTLALVRPVENAGDTGRGEFMGRSSN